MIDNGHSRFNITAQTGVSIGLLIVIVSGFLMVIKGQSDNRLETITMKTELTAEIKDLRNRMASLESERNTWTSTDMFKWAVHLQQSNPQIKVPEPEVSNR